MSRSEDYRKKRPAHLHLARQINAVHHAAKTDVCEDHGDLTPADQQGCQRRFCAFALDGVHLFVLEQRRRQAAEFSVVLNDQYGSTFLLRLPHGCSSPKRSSRSTLNRRMSAARCPGSGVETTSAKAVRNPPASVSGNSFDQTVPGPDGASRQVLRQRTFPARSRVLP